MSSDDREGSGDAQLAPAATPPAGESELSDGRTLKYSPADQRTIQQPPSGVHGPARTPQPPRPTPSPGPAHSKTISSSIAGSMGPATLSQGRELQDLSTERLLLSAPRMPSHGRQCPSLKGIPLLAKIGQGGMGAVYYGIHPRLGSEVAVKVLPLQLAEQDPGTIRRFFREAQLAAAVHSPHLVNVTDVDEESGLFFLVMEYVSGASAGQHLKAVLEKGAQGLSELDALDLTIAATEGLWAAHASNIVHRDIKPDNIMIPYLSKTTKELNLQSAKLMDLGLARNEDSQQSLTGNQSAMGTPGYMAPEQAMDAKSADKRSDVFSMGATLYALLCGHSPFKGETIMKVLMATMHEPHVPVIEKRQDISPAVNDLVEKCLSKKQNNRYGDARQLLGALQDCRRLLTGGGGPGEGSIGGLGTLVYGGAKAGAKTPAPGATLGSSIEKTGLGVAVDSKLSATGPKPQAKPKKALVLVSAVLGAAIVIGGVGAWIHQNAIAKEQAHLHAVLQQVDEKLKTCLANDAALGEAKALLGDEVINKPKYQKEPAVATRQEMLELYELLSAYNLDEAKNRVNKIESQHQGEPGLADWLTAIKKQIADWEVFIPDVKEKVEAVKLDLKAASAGDASVLAATERKINTAKRLIAKYPPLLAVEQEYARVKQKLDENSAKLLKRRDFDDMLTEVNASLDKGQNLGDAETKLNRAKDMFPDDPKLKAAFETLKKRKDFERALTLAGAALEAGDLTETEAKLATAQALFADDPRLKVLVDTVAKKKAESDAVEEKKKADVQKLIAEAGSFIDKGDTVQALEKIRAAERIIPDDPAAKLARSRVQGKQSEAERLEAAKKERLEVTSSLDDVLKKDDLAEAGRQLEAAEKKYGKGETDIVSRRQIFDARKKEADDKDRRHKLDGILANLDKLLKNKDADLFDIEQALARARDLGPNDPGVLAFDRQLKERQEEDRKKIAAQQNRKRFDGLLKEVDDIVAKPDGSLDEAQTKLDSAKELFPEDTRFKQLLADVDKKRKDKIVNEISGLLAKPDLQAAERQIKEAEANYPGNYLQAVRGELEQKKKAAEAKIAAQKERDNALKKLTTALGPTGDLAEARKLFGEFKTKYPTDDAEIAKLEPQLQKKQADADAAQEKKAAVAKVEEALRKNSSDLSAAVKLAQDLKVADDILKALKDLQNADSSIKQVADDASGKIADFGKNGKLQGTKELEQLTDARGRLLKLVPTAAGQLAASSFKDSTAVLGKLEQDRRSTAEEITKFTQRLEVVASQPKETKVPIKQQERKTKDTGSAGENNPFD